MDTVTFVQLSIISSEVQYKLALLAEEGLHVSVVVVRGPHPVVDLLQVLDVGDDGGELLHHAGLGLLLRSVAGQHHGPARHVLEHVEDRQLDVRDQQPLLHNLLLDVVKKSVSLQRLGC